MQPSETDHRVLVVLRVLDILELFEAEGQPLTLQEIARKTGVPQTTMFRLLFTLQDRGYFELDRRTGTYWPTPRIFNIGRVAVLNNRLRHVAVPFMEDLFNRFNEQVLVAVLSHGHVVYVDIIKPVGTPRLGANIGSIAPVHATSLGKAILAYLPDKEVDEIIAHTGLPPLTRRTLTTPQALWANLDATRKRGYAINDREQEEDLYGIAAPIFGDQGQVVASICVSGRPAAVRQKDPDLIAGAVVAAAQQISTRLGYSLERPSSTSAASRFDMETASVTASGLGRSPVEVKRT
jgi:DNA-binding IclR family transcriptional regulator